ncbi:hypothetical protein MTO96_018756 [Rhipicephalus appendiculatus]
MSSLKNTPGGGLCLRRSHKSVLSSTLQQDELNSFRDNENLCDLEGTKIAYAAFASLPQKYRDVKLVGLNMTSEQLYFVSHCASLCAHTSETGSQYAPFRKRCIVPLRNMPEFSRAFGCAEGTLMNPPEKCSLW